MPVWSIRQREGTREGLTVYQVQELARSGRLRPEDEALLNGAWKRVAEIPDLASLLPAPDSHAPGEGETVVVHGVTLVVGPEGKPLPPSPEVVARLLENEALPLRFDKERRTRITLVAALSVLAVLVAMAAVVIYRTRHGG